MKRVFASTCFAILCAAGVAAQTQPGDQRKASDPAKAEQKTVTITGCLREGETPNSFVLANVKADEAGAKTTPSPSTPPSTPPSAPAAGTSGGMGSAEVRLIGAPTSVDLSKHVGHTVAITGSWASASKASKPTGTSGTAGAAASAVKSFNVKSMKHQSETCQ
jgi:hypothetical protein